MRLNKILVILVLILNCLYAQKAFAEVNKTIIIPCNANYMLIFDKKILKYDVKDGKSLKAEILNSIFNDKQQMII